MEMIELQIHYNNIHNYISENYCYFNYDLKYYTEDFKETLAKAWTATKNFIVKIWNMIVNWFRSFSFPLYKNWTKLFNQAQSNWSKLKNKINNDNFTNNNDFLKAIGLTIKKEEKSVKSQINNWIFSEIIGNASSKIDHELIKNILNLSASSNLKTLINERRFTDHKGKGKYTLSERIDSFLGNNGIYLEIIESNYDLLSAFNYLLDLIKFYQITNSTETNDMIKELTDNSSYKEIIECLNLAKNDKKSYKIEFNRINKFHGNKFNLHITLDKDNKVAIEGGYLKEDSPKYKNVSDRSEAMLSSIGGLTLLLIKIIDIDIDILSKKEQKLRFKKFYDQYIQKIEKLNLDNINNPLQNIQLDEKILDYIKDNKDLTSFLKLMSLCINAWNKEVKNMTEDIVNFFKFLKENA